MFARSRAVTLSIMYYILRFWGKLKSLTKWMHFNFFFVQNFFNFFLTFPLQFLTFRLTFWKFGKKPSVSKNPFSPYVIHAIKGRSWRASSDHAARQIQQLSFENVPKMLQIMMRFLTEISENDRYSQGVGGRCKLFFADPVVGGRTKFAVWTHPFIHESSVTNFNIFTLKNVKKC